MNFPSEPKTAYTKPTAQNTHGGKTYIPTHPDLFRVDFAPAVSRSDSGSSEEEYSSRLVAVQDFPPDSIIVNLTNLSTGVKAYSSVQYGPGPNEHFELNSDLLFMNHSCNPSVYLDVSAPSPLDWHVRTTSRGLPKGENVTFLYPSTEWDMAMGFDCSCGDKDCLGKIDGAKGLSLAELEKRGYVNAHIREMKERQGNGSINGQVGLDGSGNVKENSVAKENGNSSSSKDGQ